MDQVNLAYEHIKVILGVSGGALTQGHLQAIFRRFHLNEAQQAQVMEKLAERGFRPMPDQDSPLRDQVLIRGKKPDYTPEERERHLDGVRQAYQVHMEEKPVLPQQYQMERPALKAAIAQEAACAGQRAPEKILSRAVMQIARNRVAQSRRNSRSCATHNSRSMELLESWLRWLCSGKEMRELIEYCVADAGGDSDYEELLLLLLDNTPRIITHRRLNSSLYD